MIRPFYFLMTSYLSQIKAADRRPVAAAAGVRLPGGEAQKVSECIRRLGPGRTPAHPEETPCGGCSTSFAVIAAHLGGHAGGLSASAPARHLELTITRFLRGTSRA